MSDPFKEPESALVLGNKQGDTTLYRLDRCDAIEVMKIISDCRNTAFVFAHNAGVTFINMEDISFATMHANGKEAAKEIYHEIDDPLPEDEKMIKVEG